MNAILVDTSVWIDFFNGKTASPESEKLQKIIENHNAICICPIIYQEILQGIRDDKIFEEIKRLLSDYNMINIDIIEVTNYAVNLYRVLRKRGITIRKPVDCLIASYAILGDLYLLHKDRDFTEIAKVYKLKIW
jgi:predicted nucleic acid-binding protein